MLLENDFVLAQQKSRYRSRHADSFAFAKYRPWTVNTEKRIEIGATYGTFQCCNNAKYNVGKTLL